MADIFLSYSRSDREQIDTLAQLLKAAGYSVWWDRQIVGGSEFSADIERELDASSVVVVAWSASANQSPWVRDEAAVARDAGKLLPLCLDNEVPPMGFRTLHAVDFSGWNSGADEPCVRKLLQAIEAVSTGAEPKPSVHQRASGRGQLRKLWAVLAAALMLAAFGLWSWKSFAPKNPAATGVRATFNTPEITVAGFKVRSEDGELQAMSEALAEDIASGLSRFSYLVVAAGPASGNSGTDQARFVLQGSLTRSGDTLRLGTQLIDSISGKQVWGRTFDRSLTSSGALQLQDDLTDHVVASVADPYGALMRELSASVVMKDPQDMTPYETVLRGFIYRQRIGPEDHLITRNALERGVELDPGNANIWASLAAIYTEEYKHDYNIRPDSLDRALTAARKAVALNPDNAYASFILSEAHYFRKELGAFHASAERAIELNPRDSDAIAMIGIMMGYAGSWERGEELTTRAMALNPNHPGWYRFSAFFNQYRLGNYQAALGIAERIRMPEYFPDAYARAISLAQLERTEEAHAAFKEFLALVPSYSIEPFRNAHLEKWMYPQPRLIEQIVDGLIKAQP